MLAMLCCVFSKGCQSILAKGFRKQRNLPKKLSYLVVPKNRQPCMSNTCRCEPGSSAKSCEVEVLDVTVQREENPLWGNWCNQSIERTLSFLSNPFSYYSWTIFLGLGKGDVYHCRCAQFLGAFTPNSSWWSSCGSGTVVIQGPVHDQKQYSSPYTKWKHMLVSFAIQPFTYETRTSLIVSQWNRIFGFSRSNKMRGIVF